MLLFLLLAPLAPPPRTPRRDPVFSPALGVSKHVVIYLPPGYERHPARRYGVAYYLHGIFGNESDWVALAEIDRVEDSLIATGRAPLILVMPDGDDAFYTNWAVPESRAACLADTLLVRRGTTYCTERQDYAGYIATDLVHYVDSAYRTLADRRHRGIAGLSTGGYGAGGPAPPPPAAPPRGAAGGAGFQFYCWMGGPGRGWRTSPRAFHSALNALGVIHAY